MTPFLTVFVPAYNEAGNLAHCVEVLLAKMDELDIQTEILVVDDASQDGTGALADRLALQEKRVRVIHHAHNLGIGGAFKTAVRQAQGDWLILIPADLALEPDELGRYFEVTGIADIAVGLRSDLSDYNLVRKAIHYANISLIHLLFGANIRQFQYISLYRLETLRSIEIEYWRSAFFLAEILIKALALGYRLVEVEILYTPRIQGRATGAKLKLLLSTIRDMFSFWLHWRRAGSHTFRQRVAR